MERVSSVGGKVIKLKDGLNVEVELLLIYREEFIIGRYHIISKVDNTRGCDKNFR